MGTAAPLRDGVYEFRLVPVGVPFTGGAFGAWSAVIRERQRRVCHVRSREDKESVISHAMEDKPGFDLESVAERLKREFANPDQPLTEAMEALLSKLKIRQSPPGEGR